MVRFHQKVGALALLLSAVGIYGVMAYSVSQRRREIGVRVALGAARRDITRMVVGQGLRITAFGLVVGLALALGAGRMMRSLLLGVSPSDPLTFAAVAALLLLVAVLACLVPARRAAGVDPVRAVRGG
jgi:ABC-type antimicrobial peptide transport system permease subunit